MVLLPEAWEERRDRGLACAELGQHEAAVRDLQAYLQHLLDADDAVRLHERLRGLAEGRRRPPQ